MGELFQVLRLQVVSGTVFCFEHIQSSGKSVNCGSGGIHKNYGTSNMLEALGRNKNLSCMMHY